MKKLLLALLILTYNAQIISMIELTQRDLHHQIRSSDQPIIEEHGQIANLPLEDRKENSSIHKNNVSPDKINSFITSLPLEKQRLFDDDIDDDINQLCTLAELAKKGKEQHATFLEKTFGTPSSHELPHNKKSISPTKTTFPLKSLQNQRQQKPHRKKHTRTGKSEALTWQQPPQPRVVNEPKPPSIHKNNAPVIANDQANSSTSDKVHHHYTGRITATLATAGMWAYYLHYHHDHSTDQEREAHSSQTQNQSFTVQLKDFFNQYRTELSLTTMSLAILGLGTWYDKATADLGKVIT